MLAAYEGIKQFNDAIEARVEEVERRMDEINNDYVADRDDSYFDQFGILDLANMPAIVL